MSKLAHQRAYEQYPQGNDGSSARIGYTLGYDQALQDFMEKAKEFFIEKHIGMFTQFKNYMQDEM